MSQKHYNLRENPRKSFKAREAESRNMASNEHSEEEYDMTQPVQSQTTTTFHSNPNNSEDDADDTHSSTEEEQETKEDYEEDKPEHTREQPMDVRSSETDIGLNGIAQMLKNMETNIRETIDTKMATIDDKMDKMKEDLTEKIMIENEAIKEEFY